MLTFAERGCRAVARVQCESDIPVAVPIRMTPGSLNLI